MSQKKNWRFSKENTSLRVRPCIRRASRKKISRAWWNKRKQKLVQSNANDLAAATLSPMPGQNNTGSCCNESCIVDDISRKISFSPMKDAFNALQTVYDAPMEIYMGTQLEENDTDKCSNSPLRPLSDIWEECAFEETGTSPRPHTRYGDTIPSDSHVDMNSSNPLRPISNFLPESNFEEPGCSTVPLLEIDIFVHRNIGDVTSNENSDCISTPAVANVLSGRRIVDISYLFMQIQSEKHHGGTDCSFMVMDLIQEKVNGFKCTWIFKCRMCNRVSHILSENPERKDKYMPINETAVHSILATGGGYSQLREFSAGLDMHCMSTKTFGKHMKKVSKAIDDAALKSMLEAAEEEKAIAIGDGNVDSEGVPMCTVVTDGAWCKRSYKTSYDSLSGVVSIVGFKTGKVLFIGVRNRYCSICMSYQNKNQTPPCHTCFLNWKKSATSMEADIVADGFTQSQKILGLKFNKVIGDGDSSVHKKLLETMPYGPNLMVEKVECKNHVLRNYSQKLTNLTKDTKFPVTSRNILKQNMQRFRISVDKAIKYRAAGNEPLNTRIFMLKKDMENSPMHIFGDHEYCDGYFCNGAKDGEINHVPELKSSGLLQEIMKIVSGSVSRHVSSLIADRNNNLSELFNSSVNKFVGGKRINYALRGQYQTRCSAAAVSFNNVGGYMRVIHKTMMDGNSPGMYTKKFVEQQQRARQRRKHQRLHNTKIQMKARKKLYTADEHYGLVQAKEDQPEITLTASDLEEKKIIFLASLVRTEEERNELQRTTLLQYGCHLWNSERRKLLTASHFGRVCKMRATTSCRNLVHSILYGNFSTKGTQYGIANEPVAKCKMAEDHGIVATECGLFIDSEYPFLGATPDGLVRDDAIMEIKCPLSADKYISPKEAIDNGQMTYCAITNGKPLLRRDSNYFYQVQGQMHITGRKYCYFVLYASHWMTYEIIEKDDAFWCEKMEAYLCRFYKECLLQEIVNPQFSKRFAKMDIKAPLYIITAQQEAQRAKEERLVRSCK